MKIAAFIFLLLSIGLAHAQEYDPVADPAAVVVSDNARFSVLTPRVIRMEWAADVAFEDHASLAFVNRNLPVPTYERKVDSGWLTIETDFLTLKYKVGSGSFGAENLLVEFELDGQRKHWRPGMDSSANLLGTARTLDGCDGTSNKWTGEELVLGQGILSRDGWAVIDDASRPIFDNSDWPWVAARSAAEHQDLYFFGFGYDYKAALGDFIKIAGKIALPPRFAFGAWWSRYWEYTDLELRELIEEYEIHDVPLDVLVVDMDWHVTTKPEWYKDGKKTKDQAGEGAGWTGLSWNKNYFPDPEDFLGWTESEGLKVCMNLHPASGIQPHEDQYPAMAEAMGIDPNSKQFVPFDIVNKEFARNYMDLVLRPMEKQGVDFWWLDWQQWSTTNIEGVNPIFYLNYVFFSDMQRRKEKRPLIFHRYGGLGNHRYQIGFSGDSFINWRSLNVQPHFTATAANVGFGFWSHDIGGHMYGESHPELYTRWVQFGAFSPILRTHCTKAGREGGIERRIWAYPLENYYAMREAFRLRYALLPYIYTAAREAHDTGISICRPMYYDSPESAKAYSYGNQYMFGSDLLVAPITSPMKGDSLFVMKDVWLPEGKWYEWATGALLTGDNVATRAFCIDEVPVYAKAGAVIAMQPPMRRSNEKDIDPLILNLFPGKAGGTRIYEDEGDNDGHLAGAFAITPVKFETIEDEMRILVEPVEGTYPGMPNARGYEFRLVLTYPPKEVLIDGVPVVRGSDLHSATWDYDGHELTTIIRTPRIDNRRGTTISVKLGDGNIDALSGKKGDFRRLKRFMKFLAKNNWDKSQFSNDTVVRAAQTGHRIGIDPSTTVAEIARFEDDWRETIRMVEINSGSKPKYLPHLTLLRVSGD